MNKEFLNDIKFRFLSLPRSAVEGLEHEPKKSDFNIIKELGIGSYGTVYLVSHKKTKAKYALKMIDKKEPENLEERESFNREVEIMYKLNHPNIVKLYGHFEDEDYCYFIMQYIPNNSLYSIVPSPGTSPNKRLIASVMKDLLSAIYYLHNMKPLIIHRDIKPDNVLLDQNNKAYLTDFGWSNYMPPFIKRQTVCGTPLYLPPEIVDEKGHDETADIWCFGVLFFELMTGQTPFEGDNIEAVSKNISKLNISWPPYMDPDAKDLLSKVLKLRGKDRLTIEQILNHKFFSQYFPNAVKELIKPEKHQVPTFVVSIDDPKDYGKQIRTNKIAPTENKPKEKKINDSSINNLNIRSSYMINTNYTIDNKRNNNRPHNLNYSININNNYRRNNLNHNYTINNDRSNKTNYNKNNFNSNINQRNTLTNINNSYSSLNRNKTDMRATYIPKINIDLRKSKNERTNVSINNNKNPINTGYYSSYTLNNRVNSNPYNKTNLRKTTYINNQNTYKYVNNNINLPYKNNTRNSANTNSIVISSTTTTRNNPRNNIHTRLNSSYISRKNNYLIKGLNNPIRTIGI